jgi:hypothetical protein
MLADDRAVLRPKRPGNGANRYVGPEHLLHLTAQSGVLVFKLFQPFKSVGGHGITPLLAQSVHRLAGRWEERAIG